MEETKKKRGFMGTIFALLAKSAKLAKLFKVAKPMLLFISMSISAVAYTFLFGPWLAILFVVLLLVHEMGHVVAMKMRGFDTPTPVFIPFLGAAIFAPKFVDRDTEAFVGFGGPLLGTIGSLLTFGLYFLLPRDTPLAHIVLVGSYLGTYLNLFNLLPISPLDGGRITQAAGRWMKYIGLILLAGLSLLWHQPVILYVWILVLMDFALIPVRLRAVLASCCWIAMVILMCLGYGDQPVWVNVVDCVITALIVALMIGRAFGKVPDETPDTRPDLTPMQRVQWFALYFGLAAVLVATIFFQLPLLPHHA